MAKKKRKLVQKPFQKGALTDKKLFKRGLPVLGYVLISLFLYLMIGSSLTFENVLLRVIANLMLSAFVWLIIYFSGLSNGTTDVAQGESVYRRQELGHNVNAQDVACGYHPLKGFVCGLVGCLPFFIICLIVAFTTQLKTYSLGVLPDWVESFERQSTIGDALLYYHRDVSVSLTETLRMAVRILLMPIVNIVSSSNAPAVLWVERLSPILCLIPALIYGLGYQGGPKARTQVHTDIAAAKRKQKKLEAKRLAARKSDEPERLI